MNSTAAAYQDLQDLEAQIRAANARYSAEREAAGFDRTGYARKLDNGEFAVTSIETVLVGNKAFRCTNPDCLAIFFSIDPIAECRACAQSGLVYSVVSGKLTGTPCNTLCTNAYGPDCLCSCAGENHGAKWLVGWTFPRNIEARRAEREARRALEATYGVAIKDLAAAAKPIREYFEALELNAYEAREEMLDAIAEKAQANRPPVLLTKGGKPSADQFIDLYVTRTKVHEQARHGSYNGGVDTYCAITGFDADGKKFWAKVDGPGILNWTSNRYGDSYPEVRIHKGDLVRIKGRVKQDTGDIAFLSHAHAVAWIDLLDVFA